MFLAKIYLESDLFTSIKPVQIHPLPLEYVGRSYTEKKGQNNGRDINK